MALANQAGRVGEVRDLRGRANRRRLGPRLFAFLLGSWICAIGAHAAATPVPTLDSPERVESADGSLQLSWGEQLADYEVRMRHGEVERIVYRGRMPSAHVSGLPNGEYQLQVRTGGDDGWSAWSEPTLLVVEHHPMSLVWTLVALGALVFAGTAVVVLRSDRSAR